MSEEAENSTKEKIREMFEENPDLTNSDTRVALEFIERSLPDHVVFDVEAGDIPSIGTITKASRVLRNQSDWSPGDYTLRNIPSNNDWKMEFDTSREYVKSLWEEDNDLIGENTKTFVKMVKQASSYYLPFDADDIPDIGDIHRRHRELRKNEGYNEYVKDEVDDARKEKEEAYENGVEDAKKLESGDEIYG